MLAIKFFIFAVISTSINLTFQYVSFAIYTGFATLFVGMLIGTLAGLVTKYILDKKFIFNHVVENKVDDAKKFILYSIMGGVTTIIFWGTEIAFDNIFASSKAKYIGAVIGLSIGYVIKYFLDKKYVFVYRGKSSYGS